MIPGGSEFARCPYCYDGLVIYDQLVDGYYCDKCLREVLIKEND